MLNRGLDIRCDRRTFGALAEKISMLIFSFCNFLCVTCCWFFWLLTIVGYQPIFSQPFRYHGNLLGKDNYIAPLCYHNAFHVYWGFDLDILQYLQKQVGIIKRLLFLLFRRVLIKYDLELFFSHYPITSLWTIGWQSSIYVFKYHTVTTIREVWISLITSRT